MVKPTLTPFAHNNTDFPSISLLTVNVETVTEGEKWRGEIRGGKFSLKPNFH